MKDFDMSRGKQGWGCRFQRGSMARPLVIGVALAAVLGLLVMSLWNALLPGMLGVKSISFWQAVGLLVLCRILFGGLGLRPGMFGMAREHRRMHERWMQMTPEQREQFVRQRRDAFKGRGHRQHGECYDSAECGHRGRGRREAVRESESLKPEDNSVQKKPEAE